MVHLLSSLASFVSIDLPKTYTCELTISGQLSYNDLSVQARRAAGQRSLLPVEVISTILEAAYFADDMEPDVQLLSACSLVCRSWRTPSQLLLFRQVSLRSTSSFRAFISAISRPAEHSRTLSNAVVRIRAVWDHQHPDQLSHRALALAVGSCPNLYELDLSIYGCDVVEPLQSTEGTSRIFRAAPSIDESILSMLRSGPRIRSLKIANWSDNGEISYQLLSSVWSSLEFLTLRGKAPCLPVAGDCLVVPFNSALQSLRLGGNISAHTEFLEWLMANSRHNLKSLELETMPDTEALTAILRLCGRHLESVSLASCTTRDQAIALQACRNLKEFKVETSAASPLLHTLDQLPNSVEHVAFTLGIDTPLYLMIKFIKARRSLKSVTVCVWKSGETHKELPVLRMACAWRGVNLVVLRDMRGFRASVVSVFSLHFPKPLLTASYHKRGDPLPSSSFPRTKNTLNLSRMLIASRSGHSNSIEGLPLSFDKQQEVLSALSVPSEECSLSASSVRVAVLNKD